MPLFTETGLWCPYCHDKILGATFACQCGAIYHQACTLELSHCASCFFSHGFQGKKAAVKPKLEKPVSLDQLLAKAQGIIRADPQFQEAYQLAKANAKDPSRIWLVGGKVYRTLIHVFHDIDAKQGPCDFDFLTPQLTRRLSIPDEYCVTISGEYGSSYSVSPYTVEHHDKMALRLKKNFQIDIFTFASSPMKIAPTLRGYFDAVPFDIQAIAFDLEENVIIGNKALMAIKDKKISINNKQNAQQCADKERINLLQLVWRKEKSVGWA